MQDKVCPIVLRQNQGRTEILLFRHPQAGIQLVKGTPEPLENLYVAAFRELWEESGLKIEPANFCAMAEKGFSSAQQTWHIFISFIDEPRDTWCWQTIDDYGHCFEFFWYALENIEDQFDAWQMSERYVETILYTLDWLSIETNVQVLQNLSLSRFKGFKE